MELLTRLKKKAPSHFHALLEHYDLLVHGMSEKYKIMGGMETAAQIGYQADLLRSIDELHDSNNPGASKGGEVERTGGGDGEQAGGDGERTGGGDKERTGGEDREQAGSEDEDGAE